MIAYPLVIAIVLIVLFLGYRSSAMFPMLVGAVVWVKVGNKVPIYIAGLLIAFALITIPATRYLRDTGAYQDMSQEKLLESFVVTKSSDAISEIGGTNGILANVMKWVPKSEPYLYGKSYLWGMSIVVPNFGEKKDSARERTETGKGRSNVEGLRNGNPAEWYIYKTNRWKYKHGLGSGFSTIAEAYLNFGYTGILLYFIVLGYFLGRLDSVDLRQHPKTLIFSGGFLWFLIKTVRNSFGVFVKPLGLLIVIVLIWRIITFWKR